MQECTREQTDLKLQLGVKLGVGEDRREKMLHVGCEGALHALRNASSSLQKVVDLQQKTVSLMSS